MSHGTSRQTPNSQQLRLVAAQVHNATTGGVWVPVSLLSTETKAQLVALLVHEAVGLEEAVHGPTEPPLLPPNAGPLLVARLVRGDGRVAGKLWQLGEHVWTLAVVRRDKVHTSTMDSNSAHTLKGWAQWMRRDDGLEPGRWVDAAQPTTAKGAP